MYGGRGAGIAVHLGYVIENNIIYGTSNCYVDFSASSNIRIDYNLYYLGQYGGAWYVNNKGLNWSKWQAQGFDKHGLNAVNPMLANGSGKIPTSPPWILSYPTPLKFLPTDFIPLSTSPAVGAGIDVGLKTDYAGAPTSNPPNIGAYQQGLASPTDLHVEQ